MKYLPSRTQTSTREEVPSNIKSKLILHLITLFVITGLVSIVSLFYSAHLEQTIDLEEALKSQGRLYEHYQKEKLQEMSVLAKLIEDKPEIITAFKNHNREKLLELSSPIFSYFIDLKMTHFYFITPDKKVLLRVHNPSIYGDEIERHGLNYAIATGKSITGVETGIQANLVLRYTRPILQNDVVIGYIELGQDMNDMFSQMGYLLDSNITLLINKANINILEFHEKQQNNQARFRTIGEFVVVASNLDDTSIIGSDILTSKANVVVKDSSTKTHSISSDFVDISDKSIGKIIFTEKKLNNPYNNFIKIILFSTTVVLLLGSIVFYFYYRFAVRISNLIEKQHDLLQEKATTDPLTGLHNRRYLDNIINTKLASAKRFNQTSVFIMVDIDNFKLYNDNYGHSKGDAVLVEVSKALTKYCKRSTDIITRMGGEEFGIYSMFKDGESIDEYISHILEAVRESHIIHAFNVPFSIVTVSIGYSACLPEQNKSFTLLYEEADKALYHSKANGKNTSRSFYEIEPLV